MFSFSEFTISFYLNYLVDNELFVFDSNWNHFVFLQNKEYVEIYINDNKLSDLGYIELESFSDDGASILSKIIEQQEIDDAGIDELMLWDRTLSHDEIMEINKQYN